MRRLLSCSWVCFLFHVDGGASTAAASVGKRRGGAGPDQLIYRKPDTRGATGHLCVLSSSKPEQLAGKANSLQPIRAGVTGMWGFRFSYGGSSSQEA